MTILKIFLLLTVILAGIINIIYAIYNNVYAKRLQNNPAAILDIYLKLIYKALKKKQNLVTVTKTEHDLIIEADINTMINLKPIKKIWKQSFLARPNVLVIKTVGFQHASLYELLQTELLKKAF